MSRLLDYRAAVVEHLRSTITEARFVGPHAGIFNAASLGKLSINTPAVLVSLLQSRAMRRDNVGRFVGPVLSAVYCVARDPKDTQAWGPAIELAEHVADEIELNHFVDYAAAARVRDLDVLYSGDVDKSGLAIAAVTFQQEVTWGTNRDAQDNAAWDGLDDWPEGVGLG